METIDLSAYERVHREQRVDSARFVDAATRARRDELVALARWATAFTARLRVHHAVEDAVIFPAIAARVATAGDALAALAADHHAAAALFDRIDPMMRRLARGRAREETVAVAVELRDVLDRHLDIEDSDILPLFHRHFTVEEYAALERHLLAPP